MSQRRRGPITDDEALATLQETIRANNERRISRHETQIDTPRDRWSPQEWESLKLREIPGALPNDDDLDARELFSFRIPTTLLARVRARAATEDHRGIASVIVEAFTAYADHEPGTVFTMDEPPSIVDEIERNV